MQAEAIADVSEHKIQHILRGITIPSPPKVIADLQEEMARPNPDLNTMARLISADVGLAGGVLKTVNSPFYGMRREVTSIAHAVIALGMNTVWAIVNTLSLRNMMQGQGKLSEDTLAAMTRFWDSASDMAQACVLVAKQMRLSATDRFYTLGLFHNVGIPLLMQKFDHYPDIMRAAYTEPSPYVVDTETQYLETNHAMLGCYVARSWKLPAVLCDAIAQHHNLAVFRDPDLESSELIELLRVLKIAEHLVGLHRVLGDTPVDHEWEMLGEELYVSAGLGQYDIDDMAQQVHDLGLGQQQCILSNYR